MTAPDWNAVTDLFQGALEQPDDARAAFLTQRCGGNTALRDAVERLLRAHGAAGNFLNAAVADHGLHAIAMLDSDPIGKAIGPYRLLRELGRGGMGTVYLAERADEHFRKTVAIKVIKRGMDTDGVLRRFQDERQILADLEHPNIARLLDGGTTDDGRPYFVMEHVDGDRIDRYCDERRLDIDERLALFLQVCAAVSYAHQRLVIHCDIKPSNVLVTTGGVPKLLDFGIAKLIRPGGSETVVTVAGVRAMTPEYASPEQLRSLRLDALSDVYSLGMLLCELLVGRLPFTFEVRTPEEIARVITTRDPLEPSSLVGRRDDPRRRRLRGDLDTVVLTALARERAERYQSVERLADDVRAHCEGRPIAARQERLYRALKFIRRNRVAVIAATLVLATLIAGIGATSWEAIRASRAERAALAGRDRAAAAERAATAEQNRAFRAEQLSKTERDRALQAERVATAAQRAAESEKNRAVLESRRADTESEAARAVTEFLQNDLLAQASARVQAGPNAAADPNLTVRAALDRAAARVEGRFTSQPRIEAAIRHTIGLTYKDLGLYAEAEKQLERAVALRRSTAGATDPDTLSSMRELGSVLLHQGKHASAKALLTRVLHEQEKRFGVNSAEVCETLNDLAGTISAMGRRQEAETLHARIVDILRRLRGDDHPDTLAAMHNLATEYTNEGKYALAETLTRTVLTGKRRVLGDEHPSTLMSMNGLAVIYRNEGKYRDAESLLLETLGVRRRVTGDDSPDTLTTMNSLANVYSADQRYAEAEPLLEKVIEGRRRLYGDENPDTIASMNNLAEADRRQGKAAESERLFRQVLEARRRVLGANHPNTLSVLVSLARMKFDARQFADAESIARDAVRGYEAAKSDIWQRYYAQGLLGASLASTGRYEEAERLLIAGHEGLMRKRSSISIENLGAIDDLKRSIVRLYEEWGKPDRATPWRSRL